MITRTTTTPLLMTFAPAGDDARRRTATVYVPIAHASCDPLAA